MLDKESIDNLLNKENYHCSWFETGKYAVFAFENNIGIVVTIDKENDTIEYKLTNDNGSITIGLDKLDELNNTTVYAVATKAIRIIRNIENEFITF